MTLSGAAIIAFLLLPFLGLPAVAHGQTGTQGNLGCDVYDNCALRVQHRFFSDKVVRGTESIHVARIGFGTPPLEDLFTRSDSAAVSFDQFRTDHSRSVWLTVLGGIEFIGGIVAESQGNDDLAVGLSIGGTIIEVAATIFRTRANEHLSNSIWWYNRSLTVGGVR